MRNIFYSKACIFVIVISLGIFASTWHWNKTRIDYSQLKLYLENSQWMEADKETSVIIRRLMLKKIDRESFVGASSLDFLGSQRLQFFYADFACDLLDLNYLWGKYSNEKFGFSRQADMIKTSTASTSKRQVVDPETIDFFMENLDWKSSVEARDLQWYSELTKNANATGALPSDLWSQSIGVTPKPINIEDTLILIKKTSECSDSPS